MTIKDVATGQEFVVTLISPTKHIHTKDGHSVRIHPHAIRLMVKPGQVFDGHTPFGPRKLRRIN